MKGQIFQVFTAWKNQRYHPDNIFFIADRQRPSASLLSDNLPRDSYELLQALFYVNLPNTNTVLSIFCFHLNLEALSLGYRFDEPVHIRTLLGQNNSPRYLFARDEGH